MGNGVVWRDTEPYVGELQKPRGGGPIFFSAEGGLIFKNRGGPGGALQKFSLKLHGVIKINKNIEKQEERYWSIPNIFLTTLFFCEKAYNSCSTYNVPHHAQANPSILNVT